MLPVGVDLDGDAIASAQRVAVARLDGPTDAQVHGQPATPHAQLAYDVRGGVRRTVVDDEHVLGLDDLAALRHGRRKARLLVVGGKDEQHRPLRIADDPHRGILHKAGADPQAWRPARNGCTADLIEAGARIAHAEAKSRTRPEFDWS